MYFQESEILHEQFPKEEIEKIDDFLGTHADQILDAFKISFTTRIAVNRIKTIVGEYQEMGLLSEINVLECATCASIWELNAPNKSYCENCEKVIDTSSCRQLAALKVNKIKRTMTPEDCAARLLTCSQLLLEDLQKSLQAGSVVFFVGAGASSAATRNAAPATWKGLLKEGIEWCKQVGKPPVNDKWLEIVEKEIEAGGVDHFLSVADKITLRLSNANEFKRFFNDTIGRLQIQDERLLKSIVKFDVPIMTTNYDSLLSKSANLQPILWHDTAKVHDWQRGLRNGILHVHGHWDDSVDRIILGTSSYTKITLDPSFRTMLETIRTSKTIIFLGFGSGLDDPHFSTFLKWGAEIFKGTNQRHFKLCKIGDPELSDLEVNNRITRVNYGDSYEDLAPFLECLRRSLKTEP